MDDTIRKMMEEGFPPKEIKAAIEKAKQAAAALAATPSSTTVSAPSATISASPTKGIEQPKLLFNAYGDTVAKPEDGWVNMDDYFTDSENGATGSLDGVSNGASGASQFVAPLIKEGLAQIPREGPSTKEIRQRIEKLISDTNSQLTYTIPNAYTTLSFAKAFVNEEGGNSLAVVNMGDSRVYIIRDGEIHYQTVDQKSLTPGEKKEKYKKLLGNYIKQIMESRGISAEEAEKTILSKAQQISDSLEYLDSDTTKQKAFIENELQKIGLTQNEWTGTLDEAFGLIIETQSSDNNVIYGVMGSNSVTPQIDIVDITPGDLILSFTDGVTGNLLNPELLNLIRGVSADQIPEKVINEIKMRLAGDSSILSRRKTDDITLTVMEVGQELSDKITFTNEDLLSTLNFWKNIDITFTTGSVSQNLGVTYDLAFEILENGLKTRLYGLDPIIKDNKIDANALKAFEIYISTHSKLNELFDLPPAPSTPDHFKTTLLAGELLDFLKEKVTKGDNDLNAEDLQKNFNIKIEKADYLIDKLHSLKILIDGKIIDLVDLEVFIKDTQSERDLDLLKEDDEEKIEGVDDSSKTDETKEAGPLDPDLSAGRKPGDEIESEEKNEAVNRVMENFKKKFTDKLHSMTTSRAVVAAAAFVALGAVTYLVIKGSPEEAPRDRPDATAPAPNKSAPPVEAPSAKKAESTPQNATNPEIINKNYESTDWWKHLDDQTKINIKKLVDTNNPQNWALKFFESTEVLNGRERITLTPEEQLFIYNKIIQSPIGDTLLSRAYSGKNEMITECIIKTDKTTCYIRENLANMLVELDKIFKNTDPANSQETLKKLLEPQSLPKYFKEAQKAVISIINNNAK